MKKIFLFVSLVIFTEMILANKPHTDHIQVNTDESTVNWKGSKISESHQGTVDIFNGKLLINHGVLVGGQFIIDMSSITNTDIESEKYRLKLEEHLKNEDFFDTDQFPKAALRITNAKYIKKDDKGAQYNITADLTIKGKTHSITFDTNIMIQGINFRANATIVIDRTKWGVVYNSGNFFKDLGDYLILDDIEFNILLVSK